MNLKYMKWGLIVAIIAQLVILASIYLNAAYPLWTGKEVRIATVPVDTRSWFRGNYARLRYGISRIETPAHLKSKYVRKNEVIYASLKPNRKGLYELDYLTLEKPEAGVFLRGRIHNVYGRAVPKKILEIRYGIEAYFAKETKALDLEKQLRNGAVAVLMVSDTGKVALREIIAEAPQPAPNSN